VSVAIRRSRPPSRRRQPGRQAGRRKEAWQYTHQALELARQQKTRGNEGQALTLGNELGLRPRLAHCHLGLGTLYAKIGRRKQARAELSTALELYRTMDMTFWLSQVEAALAQVEGRP
jgi:tetratricopeptide (TPR) repeat protein